MNRRAFLSLLTAPIAMVAVKPLLAALPPVRNLTLESLRATSGFDTSAYLKGAEMKLKRDAALAMNSDASAVRLLESRSQRIGEIAHVFGVPPDEAEVIESQCFETAETVIGIDAGGQDDKVAVSILIPEGQHG